MRSLQSKMLFGFLGIIIISIAAILVFNNRYFHKRDTINMVSKEIDYVHNLFLKDTRVIANLFRYDLTRPDLFLYDSTELLNKHIDLLKLVDQHKLLSSYKKITKNLGINNEVDSLLRTLNIYGECINQIMALNRKRGFKDHGIEGKMRDYIHQLEDYREVNQADILTLRRHEKDYIIRNDKIYVDKLNTLTTKIIEDIKGQRTSPPTKRDSLLNLLISYNETFNQMVEIDSVIGIKSNTGLKAELDNIISNIDNQFVNLRTSLNQQINNYQRKLNIEYILFFTLLIIVVTIISFYLAINLSKPLNILIEHINLFVNSNFKINKKIQLHNIPREVKDLISSFNNMIDQLEKREQARINAESTIVENEIRYRELAELLPVGIFETDTKGNFLFVNKAWIKSLGFTKRDVKNKMNLSQIVVKHDYKKFSNGFKTTYDECKLIRKDGSVFDAVIITNQILNNCETKGIRGIVIDNTEHKKILEALELEKIKAQQNDKLKTAFLANMSHEIRTPMNAIIGFSNLLNKLTSLNDDQKEYVDIIIKSGEHLLSLIDDIIDVAKIESGEINLSSNVCNISQLINEIANLFSNKLNLNNKQGIEIKIDNRIPTDLNINTDILRLKQILVNLMGNAIKFTEKGVIELNSTLDINGFIQFSIRDTGIGIEKDNLTLIFDAFKQAKNESSAIYSGNGLGLAISKNIVKLLGGDIWVESEVNKGSCFYFTIPYNPCSNEVNEKINSNLDFEKTLVNTSANDCTILIAEDDDSSYLYLRSYLSKYKFRILRAVNGEEAVEMCKTNEINLVFMDIHMPVMNGYKATTIINNLFPAITVVAQTAYALSSEKDKCLQAGCKEYLTKPLKFEHIDQVVYRYILTPIQVESNNSLINTN